MSFLGIIGGSGLYDLPDLTDVDEIQVTTPFGDPSSPLTTGRIGETRLAFLARHGRGHTLTPSEVPYRANIFALKQLGVSHVLSVSAVGSLRESIAPGHAMVPDQVIDRTVMRDRTFFNSGVVAHVGIADPFCETFRGTIAGAARTVLGEVVEGGTYVCIEGPQFSTRAESRLFRSWDCSVIGMTAMPEVRLAREAELCFGMVALVTDYDVWHNTEEDVSVESVKRVMARNIEASRQIVRQIAAQDLPTCESGCRTALEHAVITAPESLSTAAAARVALFRG